MTEAVSRYSQYELAAQTRELRLASMRRFLRIKKALRIAKEQGKPTWGEIGRSSALAAVGAGALLAAFACQVDMMAVSAGAVVEAGLVGNALGAIGSKLGGYELNMWWLAQRAHGIRTASERRVQNLAHRFEVKRKEETVIAERASTGAVSAEEV